MCSFFHGMFFNSSEFSIQFSLWGLIVDVDPSSNKSISWWKTNTLHCIACFNSLCEFLLIHLFQCPFYFAHLIRHISSKEISSMCFSCAGIVLWVGVGIMGLYSYLLDECLLLILSQSKSLVDLQKEGIVLQLRFLMQCFTTSSYILTVYISLDFKKNKNIGSLTICSPPSPLLRINLIVCVDW